MALPYRIAFFDDSIIADLQMSRDNGPFKRRVLAYLMLKYNRNRRRFLPCTLLFLQARVVAGDAPRITEIDVPVPLTLVVLFWRRCL